MTIYETYWDSAYSPFPDIIYSIQRYRLISLSMIQTDIMKIIPMSKSLLDIWIILKCFTSHLQMELVSIIYWCILIYVETMRWNIAGL